MTTHIENLKVGDYIAVVNDKRDFSGGGFGMFHPPQPVFSGEPLEILAINLPFLAVMNGGSGRFGIDVRVFDVQKVSQKYAEAFASAASPRRSQVATYGISPEPGVPFRKNRRRKKEKPDGTACPRCRTRMRQRLIEGSSEWRNVCPECGFDAGPAPSTT